MAVNTTNNRVLNVVSVVVSDVVTDNKSMVCGTAKAGHALAVHLLSQQQLPGYQPRPASERSQERLAGRAWRGWRLALERASASPAPLAKPWKPGTPSAGKPATRTPSIISKRLTDMPGIDARDFTGRMTMPASRA
jgi:hypothetical protein